MADKVFINDQDIIECNVVGDQTVESVTAMGKDIERLLDQLKKAHKPLLILDDLTKMKQVPPEARSVVISLAKTLAYDRLAMVGSSSLLGLGANLIIRASGRGRKMQYFTDRQRALAWLAEYRA